MVLVVVAALSVAGLIALLPDSKQPMQPEACRGNDLACLKDQIHGPNDPCLFIRITDAEKVLGVDFQAIPGRATDKCFMDTGLAFGVVTTDGAAAFRSSVVSLKDRVSLGNEAYWDPDTSVLHVLVRDRYLSIDVSGQPGPREKAIALAGLALVKIESD